MWLQQERIPGGINDFNGGAGNNVSKFNKSQIGASNEATYDAYTPQQRAELAKSAQLLKFLEIFLLN